MRKFLNNSSKVLHMSRILYALCAVKKNAYKQCAITHILLLVNVHKANITAGLTIIVAEFDNFFFSYYYYYAFFYHSHLLSMMVVVMLMTKMIYTSTLNMVKCVK